MKPMILKMILNAGVGLLAVSTGVPTGSAQTKPPAESAGWKATGTLFEACSCSVPCPCNFGQNPTHGYCHTIYAYRLKNASYNGIALDGLIFGGGEADKGAATFVDSRATSVQRRALEELALLVFSKGGASAGNRRFVPTKITVENTALRFKLDFAGVGGFTADILIGADGTNPIIVENNTTWPVHRFIKGKTTAFDYKDAVGNRLHLDGVNANLGEFSLSGRLTASANSRRGPATVRTASVINESGMKKSCCQPPVTIKVHTGASYPHLAAKGAH